MEEIIFPLKHHWRFVDSEALELKALSQGVNEKAACTKRPVGGLLEYQLLPQGLARWALEAYVPRLITSPSSWITP